VKRIGLRVLIVSAVLMVALVGNAAIAFAGDPFLCPVVGGEYNENAGKDTGKNPTRTPITQRDPAILTQDPATTRISHLFGQLAKRRPSPVWPCRLAFVRDLYNAICHTTSSIKARNCTYTLTGITMTT
jgi:hypothetical protein